MFRGESGVKCYVLDCGIIGRRGLVRITWSGKEVTNIDIEPEGR
jgi:hypothetical protein